MHSVETTFLTSMAALQTRLRDAMQERDDAMQKRDDAQRERDEQRRECDRLRAAHERLRLELELLKRRLFVAKAERVDTRQLELEFAEKLAQLNALAGTPKPHDDADVQEARKRRKHRPTGRRNLKEAPLSEERIDITDPLFESLVAQGKAKRIGYDESCKLAYQRGGMRRLVVARAKYQATRRDGHSEIETAAVAPQTFARSLAAPSLLARVATDKYCDGLPLYRLEERTVREGFRLDRGTMARWLEDAGATLGTTVVAAAEKEALSTAFCIATDATGVAVQPTPLPDKKRQPCRKGHFFVRLADRDHAFFDYVPRETSQAVAALFRGFSGYIQADAKNVYDVLYRPPDQRPPDSDDALRTEVGCWSHARTKFWEATIAKCATARQGLARIGRLFAVDAGFRGKAPLQIQRLRQQHLRIHLEAFFAWVQQEYERVKDQRGLLRSALGYALRQQGALMRVLDDGRLVLENNRSERALRRIATGRKAWLFVGSDDHGVSAGHLFSMIASARMHGLDPESYLRDIFRVLVHWPADRYLELAPRYWARTRAGLDPAQLNQELGPLDVPPAMATPQQTVTD